MPLASRYSDILDRRAQRRHVAGIRQIHLSWNSAMPRPAPRRRPAAAMSVRRLSQSSRQTRRLRPARCGAATRRRTVEKPDRVKDVKTPHHVFVDRHPQQIGVVEGENPTFQRCQVHRHEQQVDGCHQRPFRGGDPAEPDQPDQRHQTELGPVSREPSPIPRSLLPTGPTTSGAPNDPPGCCAQSRSCHADHRGRGLAAPAAENQTKLCRCSAAIGGRTYRRSK